MFVPVTSATVKAGPERKEAFTSVEEASMRQTGVPVTSTGVNSARRNLESLLPWTTRYFCLSLVLELISVQHCGLKMEL